MTVLNIQLLSVLIGISTTGAFIPSSSVTTLPFAVSSSSLTLPKSKNYELSRTTLSSTASADNMTPETQSSSTDADNKHKEALDAVKASVLDGIGACTAGAREWSEAFGYSNKAETSFYALFSGIRNSCTMGVKGMPFYLKQSEVLSAMNSSDDDGETTAAVPLADYFTIQDLEKAVNDDFLDAQRGSTDNRKGWKVAAVSEARGSSFQDARMTYTQVCDALTKGTVIFNAIGAHVPKLASATLASTDASSLPAAVNMYVTAPNKRTSAPPHTDRQDVIVVQTEGSKRWRVFKPTDPSEKPSADRFARGKGDDNLPLYRLLEDKDNLLLLDVTLEKGDVLFIPASFPHTTDTIAETSENDETSIHLTFNFDTHVWDLDYLSLRRFALRKAGVSDPVLGQMRDDEPRYVGAVNQLPESIQNDLLSSLPLGFLDDDAMGGDKIAENVAQELQQLCHTVDADTALAAEKVDPNIWKDTTNRIRKQGMDIFDVHRDMYLAAIQEGEVRAAEEKMEAALNSDGSVAMTPERMQRLSLFRVKKFYDQINDIKAEFLQWSHEYLSTADDSGSSEGGLPANWEFTLPVKVGDNVEADLGGAFFPATVTKVVGNKYDVQFFDGDQMAGLDRDMVKLLVPPKEDKADSLLDGIDTTGLTKKELKRLRKKQEKLERKRNK